MREFLVGLLVLILFAAASLVGVLLFPFLIILGFFFRFLISIALLILFVWLTGKLTLAFIAYLHKRTTP